MHVAFAVEVGESEQRVSVNKAKLLGQPGKGGLDVDWGKIFMIIPSADHK